MKKAHAWASPPRRLRFLSVGSEDAVFMLGARIIGKWKGSLSWVPMLFPILNQTVPCQPKSHCYDREQLQGLGHWRFLSTWMPVMIRLIPTKRTKQKINQPTWLRSKMAYRGAKTSINVPASLSDSPIISAVYFLSANHHPSGGRFQWERGLCHLTRLWSTKTHFVQSVARLCLFAVSCFSFPAAPASVAPLSRTVSTWRIALSNLSNSVLPGTCGAGSGFTLLPLRQHTATIKRKRDLGRTYNRDSRISPRKVAT